MTASMYPLQWPEGWPRTRRWDRRGAPYKVSLTKAVEDLHKSLRLLGALDGSIVISSNVPPRNGLGTPRNDGAKVEDPGVSVWWSTKAHGERVIACDRWQTVRENVRAAGLAIDALRSIERAGASQVLERAFTAFGQLPAAEESEPKRPWWEVLGFSHGMLASLSAAVTDARYRELAKGAHPDQGGSAERMKELTAARDEARAHYA